MEINRTPDVVTVYQTGDVWEVVVQSEDGELADGYEDIEFYETKAEAISEARRVFNNEGTARSLLVANWNYELNKQIIKRLRVR